MNGSVCVIQQLEEMKEKKLCMFLYKIYSLHTTCLMLSPSLSQKFEILEAVKILHLTDTP